MGHRTKICIYCNKSKAKDEFSLEHVIPQALGGAYAPDCLKTNSVCKSCNSILGLHVDASFSKEFMVSFSLAEQDYMFFDEKKRNPLSYRCMGKIDSNLIGNVSESECCELWLGPFGEQLYWVRPYEDKFYWYTGGNPIKTKKEETRAYFIFSENSTKDLSLSIKSIKELFKKHNIKKICCTKNDFEDLESLGFSIPDVIDNERINRILAIADEQRHCTNSTNIKYDHRFLAKICLGLGYCLFGSRFHRNKYSKELRKGLWFKDGQEEPDLFGSTNYMKPDKLLQNITGISGAVTLIFILNPSGLGVNINLNKMMNWSVLIAPIEVLNKYDIKKFEAEKVLVLIKNQMKCYQCELVDLIIRMNNPESPSPLNDLPTVNGFHEYLKKISAA